MKKLTSLCIAGCAATFLAACGNSDAVKTFSSTVETTPVPTSVSTSNAVPDPTSVPTEILFDGNETINSFLCKYNDVAEYPFETNEIEKGHVRNKAIVSTDELYITIYDLNDGIHVSIEDRNEPWVGFFATFRDSLKAIDRGITDEQAASCWDALQSLDYRVDINNTGIDTPYMINGIQTGYIYSTIYGEMNRAEILYIK